ncbi:MAG: hypothetical protein ACFHWZ_00830 [Phycisphaerales bacterium]
MEPHARGVDRTRAAGQLDVLRDIEHRVQAASDAVSLVRVEGRLIHVFEGGVVAHDGGQSPEARL